MKKFKIRMLLGSLAVFGLILGAVFGTILMDFVIEKLGHPVRFEIIFGIGGGFIAISGLIGAFAIYSNNMGDGFKD